MKIAICISGLIGHTAKGGKGIPIDFYKTKKYFDQNLLTQNAEIHYFLQCWNEEFKEELIELYKPKKFKFQKSLEKKPNLSFKEYGIISNQFSKHEVIKLKIDFENENKFKYDLVILTRFDVLILKPINIKKLNLKKFYVLGPKYHHNHSCNCMFCDEKNPLHGLNDFLFISSSKKMDEFAKLYNYLNEYQLTNNHTLTKQHLIRLNYYKDTDYILKCITNLYPSIWNLLERIGLFPSGMVPARIYECDTLLIRWVDKSYWLKFLDIIIFKSKIDILFENTIKIKNYIFKRD